MKSILKSRAAQSLFSALVALYIWFVYRTSRWTTIGGEEPNRLFEHGDPFIMAVWHGRGSMMVYSVPDPDGVRVLVSNHRDGEFLARTIRHFGFDTIRGSARAAGKSSDKGGTDALRGMIRAINSGRVVFITPDGPRGPRMRASEGTIKLAQLTGAPILCASYSMQHRRVIQSWDRLIVPRPFSRGVFLWGEPIHVPRDADVAQIEVCRSRLEHALNAVTRQADELVGQPAIEPAPLSEASTSA